MKITIIHGQSHEGSTCHMARMVADKIGGDVTEFFLPRDFGEFCCGCTSCIVKSHDKCPHYEKLKPLTDALDEADVIILESPVYVYHCTGSMKAFLDHYGYRWMVHRPDERMFKKQVVCVASAAGAGLKSTLKDMADSAYFWGCAKIYKFGVAVQATSWNGVSDKIMKKIETKSSAIAGKVKNNHGKAKPSFKTKAFFNLMSMIQKNGWNEADVVYWREKDWIGKARPWK